MLEASAFMRDVVSKPIYFYFSQLLFLSPTLFLGLLVGIAGFAKFGIKSLVDCNSLVWDWLVLFLWPIGFIAPMTALGHMGAGFQTRFLLPALPGLALMVSAAVCLSIYELMKLSSSERVTISIGASLRHILCLLGILVLCVGISASTSVYYGILAPTLYADLDHSIVDIIQCVVDNIYAPPTDSTVFQYVLSYLRHLGIQR